MWFVSIQFLLASHGESSNKPNNTYTKIDRRGYPYIYMVQAKYQRDKLCLPGWVVLKQEFQGELTVTFMDRKVWFVVMGMAPAVIRERVREKGALWEEPDIVENKETSLKVFKNADIIKRLKVFFCVVLNSKSYRLRSVSCVMITTELFNREVYT